MAENFDTTPYYRKLASNEPLTEDEIVSLLKAVDSFRNATAYLADCHAATLESMPRSASKSARTRMESICKTSAELLDGGYNPLTHRSTPDAAQKRCLRVIEESKALVGPVGT
jgi:hypothetical protein